MHASQPRHIARQHRRSLPWLFPTPQSLTTILQWTTDVEVATNAPYILLSCLVVSLDHPALCRLGAQFVAGVLEAWSAWGVCWTWQSLMIPKGTLTALHAPREGYIFSIFFLKWLGFFLVSGSCMDFNFFFNLEPDLFMFVSVACCNNSLYFSFLIFWIIFLTTLPPGYGIPISELVNKLVMQNINLINFRNYLLFYILHKPGKIKIALQIRFCLVWTKQS
jgi:hypothetical protein